MYSRYSKQVNQLRKHGECFAATIEKTHLKNNEREEDNDDEKVEACYTSTQHDNVSSHETDRTGQPGSRGENHNGSEETERKALEVFSLEELWHRLCHPPTECRSLLKKHLTPDLFNQLKEEVTVFGGRLEDCIRSGKRDLGRYIL